MSKLFLLADDDRDDAEIFGEAIAGTNPPVEFRHVENGRGVFDYLDTAVKRPDIIFLDLNMPEMNGWQCLVKLKDDVRYQDIPVIMYSTSSHQRDRSIALDLGAVGFLTKPTDFKALKKMLGEIADADTADLGKVLLMISICDPFRWKNYSIKNRLPRGFGRWLMALAAWLFRKTPQVSGY